MRSETWIIVCTFVNLAMANCMLCKLFLIKIAILILNNVYYYKKIKFGPSLPTMEFLL